MDSAVQQQSKCRWEQSRFPQSSSILTFENMEGRSAESCLRRQRVLADWHWARLGRSGVKGGGGGEWA
eukprot:5610111-Pleurochrysis_carterae.AAC.2